MVCVILLWTCERALPDKEIHIFKRSYMCDTEPSHDTLHVCTHPNLRLRYNAVHKE